MALLGPQLVFTIVMTSLLQKVIAPYHSFAMWLIARGNLNFFSYPSDEDLKKAAGIGQTKTKKKRNRAEIPKSIYSTDEPFTVPKNIDLDLTFQPITFYHTFILKYLAEFRWLIDFSCMAVFVYCVTEAYYAIVRPESEINLSLIWMVMMAGFAVHILLYLTSMYFHTEDTGEMTLCVTFGFFFMVIAMAMLIVDEDILELGIENSHDSFMDGATTYLKTRNSDYEGPVSMTTFKILLTAMATVIGAIITFPGLRYAKMYVDALKYYGHQPVLLVAIHISFFYPLVIIMMWIKPVARDYFKSATIGKKVEGDDNLLMSDDTFDLIRYSLIPVFCILRVCLTTVHLQSYLNMAKERFESLKKEAGRIKSVDLQKMIIQVYSYLCVVALQYFAPLVLLIGLSCLLKTTGDISYHIFDNINILKSNSTSAMNSTTVNATETSTASSSSTNPFEQASEQFAVTLSTIKSIFSPVFFQGIYTFLTWWTCVSWFVSSLFGVFYHSYLTG